MLTKGISAEKLTAIKIFAEDLEFRSFISERYFLVYHHITSGIKVLALADKEEAEKKIKELENNVKWAECITINDLEKFRQEIDFITKDINYQFMEFVETEGKLVDIKYWLLADMKNNKKHSRIRIDKVL